MDDFIQFLVRCLFGFIGGIFMGMGLKADFPHILMCGFAGTILVAATVPWSR